MEHQKLWIRWRRISMPHARSRSPGRAPSPCWAGWAGRQPGRCPALAQEIGKSIYRSMDPASLLARAGSIDQIDGRLGRAIGPAAGRSGQEVVLAYYDRCDRSAVTLACTPIWSIPIKGPAIERAHDDFWISRRFQFCSLFCPSLTRSFASFLLPPHARRRSPARRFSPP
jgi:hypothetical protein